MTEENLKRSLQTQYLQQLWLSGNSYHKQVLQQWLHLLKDADHQNFLGWAMKNTDVMNTYLEGGSPTGKIL